MTLMSLSGVPAKSRLMRKTLLGNKTRTTGSQIWTEIGNQYNGLIWKMVS